MMHPTDAARRRLGVLFLVAALGLLILGQTVLKAWLGQGLLFVFYWLACLGFTLLAMLTALLDASIVRLRARQEHLDELKRNLGRDKPDQGEAGL